MRDLTLTHPFMIIFLTFCVIANRFLLFSNARLMDGVLMALYAPCHMIQTL